MIFLRIFKKISLRIRLIFLLLPFYIAADAIEPIDPYHPWWTGSLIARSGKVVPVGTLHIEPYLIVNNDYGRYLENGEVHYTAHFVNIETQVIMTTGIFPKTDLQFIVREFNNHFKGQSKLLMGDSSLKIGFQVLEEKANSWMPYARFVITEVIPTGQSNGLDPDQMGVDSSGIGAFITELSINLQKTFVLSNCHPLRLRTNVGYFFPSHAHVEGFNSFGGGFGTTGNIRTGSAFRAIVAMEYGITRHWVAALDVFYQADARSKFSGTQGMDLSGNPAFISLSSSYNLSIAPAMEFNYNDQAGVIVGFWLSLAGRNSPAFFTPAIAVNLTF